MPNGTCKIVKVEALPLNAPNGDDFNVEIKCGRTIIEGQLFREHPGQVAYNIPDLHEGLCTISWFGIKKGAKNRGVGTLAYPLLEEFAKNKGCTTLRLIPQSNKVRSFWYRLGFVTPGEPDIDDPDDSLDLRKELREL